MSAFRYDTYCGLYCGACDILATYKTGASLPPQFQGVPFEIKCHGCKSDTLFGSCRNCPIRSCAIANKVDYCSNCAKFPCSIFTADENKDLLSKLPHLKAIPQNLMTIKEKGVKYWLREQERKWQCPQCGTGFSWYTATCSNCGKDLEKEKDYNKE